MDEPATSRPILDWLPTYLAVLSISGHGRALHVAKVDEATVQAARATYPTVDDACRRILANRERREAERKLLAPPPADTMPPHRYPREWMAPFLVVYAACGHLDHAAAFFHVQPRSVRHQLRRCPEFAAAFAQAQAQVAERIWQGCPHRVSGLVKVS